MRAMRLHLFGQVVLKVEGRALRFPTKKSKSLCAYLAVFRSRTFGRSFLAAQFWPDSDEAHALRSLNTELWRLRTVFKSAGLEPQDLLSTDECVGLLPHTGLWIDAAEFEHLTQGAAADAEVLEACEPRLRQAIELYAGDLAQDLFDEWCILPREQYRLQYIQALEILLKAHLDAGRHPDAITIARKLVQTDPLLEHGHRALIECHLKLGHRAAALKQYAECAAILHTELHIEPMPETRRLIESLGTDAPAPTPHRLAQQLAAELQAQPFEVALASLSTARTLLEEAIAQLQARGTHASVRGVRNPTNRR